MLRNLTILLLLLMLTDCKLIHRKRHPFHEGGGSYIDPIDSSLKKDICIVHFKNSIGVIFPAAYGKERFGGNKSGENKSFFTPDSTLIIRVDKEINYQYCLATESYWGTLLHKMKQNSLKPVLTPSEKNLINEISVSACLNWQKCSAYYDKQYIGYITASGEKIIMIKLIDFRQDPHKLKPFLTTSWIDGWHGWFYSNIQIVFFHINKNQLIIREDF